MATAKEILEYRRQANDGTLGVYYNSDILHATIIMTALLKKALKDDAPINIFCGKLSLFSNSAKEKVARAKADALSLDELTDAEKSEWDDFNPTEHLKEALLDYINEKADSIKIIIENWTDKIKELPIWEELKKNKVALYILRSNLGLDHFTVTKNAYRIENSDVIKSASGSFMDPVNARMLEGIFEQQLQRSERYEY